MKKCVRAVFVWLCYAGFSSARQDMGIITCHVTDANGFAVPGAAVSVISGDTNVGNKALLGSDCIFVATPLKIGMYSVQVEAKGFKNA